MAECTRHRRPPTSAATPRPRGGHAPGNSVKSDIDYFVRNPLTAKDGVVVVWAGMRGAILDMLQSTAEDVDPDDADSPRRHQIAVRNAQRSALLDERDKGAVDADMLTHGLYNLDAAQIALEMRGDPA